MLAEHAGIHAARNDEGVTPVQARRLRDPAQVLVGGQRGQREKVPTGHETQLAQDIGIGTHTLHVLPGAGDHLDLAARGGVHALDLPL